MFILWLLSSSCAKLQHLLECAEKLCKRKVKYNCEGWHLLKDSHKVFCLASQLFPDKNWAQAFLAHCSTTNLIWRLIRQLSKMKKT